MHNKNAGINIFLIIGIIISCLFEWADDYIKIGGVTFAPMRIWLVTGFILVFIFGDVKNLMGNLSIMVASVVFISASSLSLMNSSDFYYSLKRLFNIFYLYSLPVVFGVLVKAINFNIISFELIVVRCAILSAIFSFFQLTTGFFLLTEETRVFIFLEIPRINSLFLDKNFYAYFSVISIGITISLLGFSKKSFWLIFLFLSVIVCTGSRGGYIMVAALFFSIFVMRFPRQISFPILLISITAIPTYLMVGSFFNFDDIYYSASLRDTESASAGSRIMAWHSGLIAWTQYPYFGIGVGNFVEINKGYFLPTYIPYWVSSGIDALAGHSNYIEALVESGIFGYSAYILLVSTYFVKIFNKSVAINKLKIYAPIYVACCFGFMFLTYNSLIFLLMCGAVCFCDTRSEN
ncbi:O-antigen ligase family protein [Sphaerotilus natans]|uniref:O-antigen ligase family protein n=1 Tax=Sphaerotilus natans TaxID=34103 RepID=UPI00406C1744